jgi:hypothetical protein
MQCVMQRGEGEGEVAGFSGFQRFQRFQWVSGVGGRWWAVAARRLLAPGPGCLALEGEARRAFKRAGQWRGVSG